jgi:hypothetical protein
VDGCELITAEPDPAEIHPLLSVTVKVYVPELSPEKLAVVPEFEIVAPPGDAVTVQIPVDGSPLKETVPVDTEQVGCVIEPVIGAVGV